MSDFRTDKTVRLKFLREQLYADFDKAGQLLEDHIVQSVQSEALLARAEIAATLLKLEDKFDGSVDYIPKGLE